MNNLVALANRHLHKKKHILAKKTLIQSYLAGIFDTQHGESYASILRYFLPEFITTLVLYALVPLIDAQWISALYSTSLFATVGVTNTLLHFIIKTAEGFSIGTVILTGSYNGRHEYRQVGKSLTTSFWVTCFVGGALASLLFMGARSIYCLYGVPKK